MLFYKDFKIFLIEENYQKEETIKRQADTIRNLLLKLLDHASERFEKFDQTLLEYPIDS